MQAKIWRSLGDRQASKGVNQYLYMVKAEDTYTMMSVATEEALSC